jgi:hypothetical protein
VSVYPPNFFVLYSVRVVSKERRLLVIPRTPCLISALIGYGQIHASAALSTGKQPQVALDTKMGRPQKRSGYYEERDIYVASP